jgi:GTP pyrophosphokinase
MKNESGSLADISSIIAGNKVNIANIKITKRSFDFFELVIDVEVKNLEHLEEILSALRTSDKTIEVTRAE